jgi:hypothetical protein
MRWNLRICLLLASLAGTTSAHAQATVETAGPGAHVRVTMLSTLTAREILVAHGEDPKAAFTPGETLEGVLLAVDDQLVSVQVNGRLTALAVPRRAIARLEKAVGRRSRARYAVFGALLGAGAGAVLASALTDCSESWCLVSPAAPGAVLGAGAGAIAGAVITPSRRWVEIDEASLTPIPEAPQVGTHGARSLPKWRLAFQLGAPIGGPARDLEEAMRRHGFADASAGFGHDIPHPVSDPGFEVSGPATLLEMHYRVRTPWTLGLTVSRIPMGQTRGYRADGFQYLDIQYQSVTGDVVLSRDLGPVRLGAGPAWHRARVRESTGPVEQPWTSTSRIGFVLATGARLPTTTRVYLDLSVQYRYVGSVSVGPITSASPFSSATLPATEVRFNYWVIGFGPGIRF